MQHSSMRKDVDNTLMTGRVPTPHLRVPAGCESTPRTPFAKAVVGSAVESWRLEGPPVGEPMAKRRADIAVVERAAARHA